MAAVATAEAPCTPGTGGLPLRPYQEDALSALERAAERGVRRPLVVLPTGTGKTVCFSETIRRRGGTALILAHRDELLRQAADKLRTVAPELAMSVGFVQASRDDVGAPIVLGSVQTLARASRRRRLPARFTTVVIDEAHHATAKSYRDILDHVDAELVVGFTATPERSDSDSLDDVWDEIVYARSLLDMIGEGYLSDLRGVQVPLADFDLSTVKVTAGDYQAEDLGKAMRAARAPEQTATALLEHARDRKTIVFCPTVDLAAQTAAALRDAGVNAGHVHGDTPADERRQLLDDFAAGRLQAITNVDVLTEGFDEPSVECVAIAAPTRSRVAYVQRVGRGTRLHPGKDHCLVLDLVSVSDDIKLQSLPAIFGLKKKPRRNETISQAAARQAAEETAQQLAADQAPAPKPQTARDVDLFGARDRLHWIRIGERWVIGAGDNEYLVLDPLRDDWRVLLLRQTGAKIVASGLDLGYAQGAAEEAVRKRDKMKLADSNAAWRRKPPSDGQIHFLRKLGIATAPETAGEAADRITERLARRQLVRLDRAIVRQAACDAGPGGSQASEPGGSGS